MITVYEADNRFFVQYGLTVQEVSPGIVEAMESDGLPINLIHMEGRD